MWLQLKICVVVLLLTLPQKLFRFLIDENKTVNLICSLISSWIKRSWLWINFLQAIIYKINFYNFHILICCIKQSKQWFSWVWFMIMLLAHSHTLIDYPVFKSRRFCSLTHYIINKMPLQFDCNSHSILTKGKKSLNISGLKELVLKIFFLILISSSLNTTHGLTDSIRFGLRINLLYITFFIIKWSNYFYIIFSKWRWCIILRISPSQNIFIVISLSL